MTTLIVAYNKNFVIADKEGNIPWHIPEDLKFFKEMTTNNSCIMGRKTWESIPIRPLPNRFNIIVSRSYIKLPSTNVAACNTVEAAIALGKQFAKEVFVIGGG